MKKTLILLPLLALLLAGCNNKDTSKDTKLAVNSDHIIFWGEGCSHCANVEKFLEENAAKEKLGIDMVESFSDREGAKLYSEKAEQCGEDSNIISVPMMYWEGECISGDTPIIDKIKEVLK